MVFLFYYPSLYPNNKNNHNKPIRLLNLRILLEPYTNIYGFNTYPYNKKVSFNNLPIFLENLFGIKHTHIKNFNSIHSTCIKNKNISVFVVLLDPNKFKEIIELLESNGHWFVPQTKLLFYNNPLNISINVNIVEHVLNYYNNKQARIDGITCINNTHTNLKINTFLDIVGTLRGMI